MPSEKKIPAQTRRQFMTTSALGLGAAMIVPRHVLGGVGYKAPSDRLNIAGVGVGGRGRGDLHGVSQWNKLTLSTEENIVALCDVDESTASQTFKDFPKAKRFQDYRTMLDSISNEIDAVVIATPDHMHGIIAMAAMQLDKHVYVEKPLTHDIYEARMLTLEARKRGLATQMGNQGNSSDDIRRICEWVWSGLIGDVHEVHCWTNRPVWAQGIPRPSETPAIPSTLDWNLWLGTAPERPYHNTYVPFGWRGWWDFGTGALGDMACHIMDPAFKALKLGYPSSVEACIPTVYVANWTPEVNTDSCPVSSMVYYEFPAREGMPPVRLTWYDGGLRPPRPAELLEGEEMGDGDGGVLFIGSKGKLMCGTYARNPKLLPLSRMKDFQEPAPMLPRVEGDHHTSWVEACKGGPAASSNFNYAGPFTEMVLMGNLALRSFNLLEKVPNGQGNMVDAFTGRKKLLWDGENMQITNYELANQFVKRTYRENW